LLQITSNDAQRGDELFGCSLSDAVAVVEADKEETVDGGDSALRCK